MKVKSMAKEVLRIGRLYLESVGSDLHLMILDFHDKDGCVNGTEVILQPKQVFELMEAPPPPPPPMVKEKACVTCVNFEDGCKLEPKQRLECNQNQKSLYIPAYPTA